MPTWYKVVVKATALTQEVNTILYYGTQTPSTITWDPAVAEDLGELVGSAQASSFTAQLPTVFEWQSADISMVDDDGETVSPYIVTVPLGGTGALSEAVDTVAMVAIAKFNCNFVSESSPHSVPRRSYVCIGPVLASQIGQGGALSNVAALQAGAETAFTQGHLISGTIYDPYRIGRTVAPSTADPDGSLAGVGKVVSVTVRPYVSYRRSRLIRPNGS